MRGWHRDRCTSWTRSCSSRRGGWARATRPRGPADAAPHEWSDPEPFVELARQLDRGASSTERAGGRPGRMDWIGLAPDGGFAPISSPRWNGSSRAISQLGPGLGGRWRARSSPPGQVTLRRWPAGRGLPRWRRHPPISSASGATGWSRYTNLRRDHPGAWSSPRAAPAAGRAPARLPQPGKGHLLATSHAAALPGPVAVATQLEDGRLLVGGTFDAATKPPRCSRGDRIHPHGLYPPAGGRGLKPPTSGAASAAYTGRAPSSTGTGLSNAG